MTCITTPLESLSVKLISPYTKAALPWKHQQKHSDKKKGQKSLAHCSTVYEVSHHGEGGD